MNSTEALRSLNAKVKHFGITHRDKSPVSKCLRVRIPKIDNPIYSNPFWTWCEDTAGDTWIWSSPTQTEYTDIYFQDPQTALFFNIKFGGVLHEPAGTI